MGMPQVSTRPACGVFWRVSTVLRRLYPYLAPYRRDYLLGLLMVVLANAFAILAPRLLGMPPSTPWASPTSPSSPAPLCRPHHPGRLLGGARYGMRQLLNSASRRVETDLRDDFFAHLMRLDASFYGHWRTGDLMSRATNDILSVRMAVGPAIMYSVNTVVLGALALGSCSM
jgi:ATP-binding cassette, subfamily B, multidrug efflux pump